MEERGTVFVEPKVVAEVKFGDIQESSLHKVWVMHPDFHTSNGYDGTLDKIDSIKMGGENQFLEVLFFASFGVSNFFNSATITAGERTGTKEGRGRSSTPIGLVLMLSMLGERRKKIKSAIRII